MNCWKSKRIWSVIALLTLAVAAACSSSKPGIKSEPQIGEIVEGLCELEVSDASADSGTAEASDAGSADSDAGAAGSTATSQPVIVTPNFLSQIGCSSDFNALASVPMDATLPGARSGKVVLDTAHDNTLYFQNSKRYQIHWDFVLDNLQDPGAMSAFEQTQYYVPESDRRFLLAAVTHYEGPGVWALEFAPYDTATPSMIKKLFDAVKSKAFFGPGLRFHPTSETLETTAKRLDASVPVITTNDLYGSIDYQPLVITTAMGLLQFYTSAQIESGVFIPYNSIVVLDQAPNDISVVAGIITEQFQSPLSHINVLASNRQTPNMGLRNAKTVKKVLSLKDKWVRLTVGTGTYSLDEVTAEEAEAYYIAHKPKPVTLPPMDTSITSITDIKEVVPNFKSIKAADARNEIQKKVPAFGGKAANYSVLAQSEDIPIPKAFAVPIFYYDQFMKVNGYYDVVDDYMQDAEFRTNPTLRMEKLRSLRNSMMKGQIDPGLQEGLRAKLAAEFTAFDGTPLSIRFRTSTNSEDLDAFPCAGCYESHSGDPANWEDVLNAIRITYASIWLYRTFEERDYYGVDQKSVGMALLVHHAFANETANGVAVTANPFDTTGLSPAFYVNVEYGGDAEVVHLPPGVTTDQFLYYFGTPNNPIAYISHSNLIPAGTTVLTKSQAYQLGTALDAIHQLFFSAYRSKTSSWYAMDVEFKFAAVDYTGNTTSSPTLWVKQARPYPGRGKDTGNTSND